MKFKQLFIISILFISSSLKAMESVDSNTKRIYSLGELLNKVPQEATELDEKKLKLILHFNEIAKKLIYKSPVKMFSNLKEWETRREN